MNPVERVECVRAGVPEEGLFEGKTWRISPFAFGLNRKRLDFLEGLGERLYVFTRACNLLYRQSVRGKAPEWVARWMDAGKHQGLIEISREAAFKNELPKVIRPDLILMKEGFALSEVDSVPGGVGLTAWLNRIYGGMGEDVVGGMESMRQAVERLFPEGDFVIAEEALTYLPEWKWLLGEERIKRAEDYRFNGRPVYRFFEAFDWPNLTGLRESWDNAVEMTPPLKPYLEEKMWLALFWMKPLEGFWRQELGKRYFEDLKSVIPYGWVVNPEPLPPHGMIPGLEIQDWREAKEFSQKERELVLKISGFSPLAWGSRGVTVGSDVSSAAWGEAIERALEAFPKNPYVLQRFAKGAVVEQEFWDEESGAIRLMKGRVRLCPYYFVEEGGVRLRGIQATICPADKKMIHGMRDAIIAPVKLKEE